MTFLLTSPPLARALAERNFDRLTQVQTAVLADEAAGRDLLVSAQTGSGKTAAHTGTPVGNGGRNFGVLRSILSPLSSYSPRFRM